MTDYPTIQAKNYTRAARKLGEVKWIVLHSTEGPRVKRAARGVAEWFAGRQAPQASAHYVIDADEVILCVPEPSIAWTQGKANPKAIGLEIVGKAAMTREQWLDEYGEQQLDRVARLVAEIAYKWNLPLVAVDAEGVRRDDQGVTTHYAITRAYSVVGGHTDPGPGFPMDWLLDRASFYLTELQGE